MASNETQSLMNTTSDQILTTIDGSVPSLSSFVHHFSPRLNAFPELPCLNLPHLPDTKDIHLEYWRTGCFCYDSECSFKIESTLERMEFNEEAKEGVFVTASANITGRNIFCQLIDLVESCIKFCQWHPDLLDHNGLDEISLCIECMKEGRVNPFKISLKHCLVAINYENARSETKIGCGYFCDDLIKNHTVLLADIVPELFLLDISPNFLLDAEGISCNEDDSLLLGKGSFGKVYHGKYNSRSVAVKRYCSIEETSNFRSEALIHQQLHHPCIVNLIGVCTHPLKALVLEEALLRSLEFLLFETKILIHRLTALRIATEVAAALHYIHSQGIISRNLKAADVLLWTLDPASLCHCKLCDFGNSSHLFPMGVRGLSGSKIFHAPEVLYIGKRVGRSTYDHQADIFMFGMFLYELIFHKRPYHDLPPSKIDFAILSDECPQLDDTDILCTGFHYLTRVMKTCWEHDPKKRPSANTICTKLCQSATQMVMCVAPISRSTKLSFCQAVAISPLHFSLTGHQNRLQSELWVSSNGVKGAEISMFRTNCMIELTYSQLKDSHVQCMALCGQHVWIGSRLGIKYGAINLFDINSRELVHSFRLQDNHFASCITATDTAIYLGTLEGHCFCYCSGKIGTEIVPMSYSIISDNTIDGIVCTQQCVWVSHRDCMHQFSKLQDPCY